MPPPLLSQPPSSQRVGPSTRSNDVTPRSGIPQGTIVEKSSKFVETLSAKPCDVIQRLMRTPMAASFSSRPAGPTHTPLSPGTRTPVTPKLADRCNQDALRGRGRTGAHRSGPASSRGWDSRRADRGRDRSRRRRGPPRRRRCPRRSSSAGRRDDVRTADAVSNADGHHRRVLEQDERVADCAAPSLLHQLLLELERAARSPRSPRRRTAIVRRAAGAGRAMTRDVVRAAPRRSARGAP